MRMRWLPLLAVSVLLLPSAAIAQEARERATAGVFVAYPGSIGITWNISPHVAIRPDAFFTSNWADSNSVTTTATSTSTTNNVGGGIAALFYLRKRESLSVYLAPRFGYSRTTGDVDSSAVVASSTMTSSTHTSSANYLLSGSIGAEHPISRRFAVFGELGLAYSKAITNSSRTDAVGQGSHNTAQTIGTRASVGTIIYF